MKTATATKLQPIAGANFRLEDDNFKHFGLQSGDTLIIKTDVNWQDVIPRQLCLVQLDSPTSKQWLAAVEPYQYPEDFGEDQDKEFLLLHNGFFSGNSTYNKDALILVGIVTGFQRDLTPFN